MIEEHFRIRGALSETALAALDALVTSGAAGQRLAPLPVGALAPITEAIAARVPGMRPVRAVAFDKSPQANWGVGWHQDRVIAVAERAQVDGFSGWSQKGGIWHVNAPTDILSRMLFVRVHLDPADEQTGAMEFVPGSHRLGRIPEAEIAATLRMRPTELDTGARGDILVLPMLTLHRSRPAVRPTTRRTLRVDYADAPLPHPLNWAAETKMGRAGRPSVGV